MQPPPRLLFVLLPRPPFRFPLAQHEGKKKNKQATPLSSSSGGSCLFIALSPSTSFSQSSNNPKRAEDLTARRLSCLFSKRKRGRKRPSRRNIYFVSLPLLHICFRFFLFSFSPSLCSFTFPFRRYRCPFQHVLAFAAPVLAGR